MRWYGVLGAFFVLLSFHGFNAYTDDELAYIFLAHRLADAGALTLPADFPFWNDPEVEGPEWTVRLPGWPAVLAPFSWAGREAAARFVEGREARLLVRFRVTTLAAPVLGLFLLASGARLLFRLGFSPRAAWCWTFALFAGTPSWFYARTLHDANLHTLLVLLGVLAAASPGVGAAAAAGLALGGALLVRPEAPLFALLVAPAALLAGSRSARFPRGAAYAAPVAAFFAVRLGYHWIRYGTFFGEGKYGALFAPGDFFTGLWLHLGAPGRGLIFYAPVALAGLAAAVFRKDALGRTLGAVGAANLLLAATFENWIWTWDWGPRYLHLTWYALGPLAVASPALRARPWLLIALCAAGALVNFPAFWAEYAVHYRTVGDTARIVTDYGVFPPAGQFVSLARGAWDLFLWREPTWLVAALLAGGGAALVALGLRRV